MRNLFYILTLLGCINGFTQTVLNEAPANFNKIHFHYNKQSNYYFDDKGVYGDSLMFVIDFPNMKTEKAEYRDNKVSNAAFVSWEKWSKKDKDDMKAILYHTNENMEGMYDSKKNITVITVKRDDPKTKAILKKYFNSNLSYFKYTITIDYNKKTMKVDYPNVNYNFTFRDKEKPIRFTKNNFSGFYGYELKEFVVENGITLNDKLHPKIVPGEIFTNNIFGVQNVSGLNHHVQLISVSYE